MAAGAVRGDWVLLAGVPPTQAVWLGAQPPCSLHLPPSTRPSGGLSKVCLHLPCHSHTCSPASPKAPFPPAIQPAYNPHLSRDTHTPSTTRHKNLLHEAFPTVSMCPTTCQHHTQGNTTHTRALSTSSCRPVSRVGILGYPQPLSCQPRNQPTPHHNGQFPQLCMHHFLEDVFSLRL